MRAAGMLVALGYLACAVPAMEPKRDGPWAYTKRMDERADRAEYMAATPSAEDGDVWLVIACAEGHQITTSLMDVADFPYQLDPSPKMLLQSEALPAVAIPATLVQASQLTAAPAVTRHIFDLLIQSNKLVVTVREANGPAHAYSFSLQPHDVALNDITRFCLDIP